MEHPSPPCTGTRRHWRPSERRNCERSAVCEHVYCGFEASRAALRSARWEGNEIAERAVRSCSVDTVARCGARDGARIRLLRFRTSMSRIEQRPRIVRTPGRCGRDIVNTVRDVRPRCTVSGLYPDVSRPCDLGVVFEIGCFILGAQRVAGARLAVSCRFEARRRVARIPYDGSLSTSALPRPPAAPDRRAGGGDFQCRRTSCGSYYCVSRR